MRGSSKSIVSSIVAKQCLYPRVGAAASRACSSLWPAVCERLEERRLFAAVAINGSVTLDESAGLQVSGVAVAGEDNNDNDVALSTLQSQAPTFYTRLFTGLGLSTTFATQNGVAKSADNFIAVTGTGTITSLGFTKADGSALPVLGGADPGVASGLSAVTGGAITLFADSVLGNRMVVGVDTAGDKVFALFLDPASGLASAKVWVVQFEAISNPGAGNPDDAVSLSGLGVGAGSSLQFDFDQLHSGSNLFGTIGDTTNALVIIAEHPKLKADGTLDTSGQAVKTSQGGTGATIGVDSQMVDPGEGVFFTYVKGSPSGLVGANLDQGEANDSAAIQYSNGTLAGTSASMTISQTQGGGTATMTISTFDVAGSPQQKAFVDGINTAGAAGIGTAVAVTSITIHKANGTTVTETAGGANTSANISFAGGVATVSGLDSGDSIEWTTSAAHDRVLIKGVAGKFDIGGFAINESSSAVTPLTGVRFEDSGPSITGTLSGAPTMTVDESTLATNATGAFAGQFTPLFGTDGQGATPVGYALSTPGGNSGLVDTATGLSVFLFKVGNDIVGKAGADAAAAASGPTVFVVSVASTGVVTLDQQRAIVHPTSNPDESKTLSASNLVVLTATASDKDGDTAATSLNIGQLLVMKDDGPSITGTLVGAPTMTVDESDFATNATGAFAGQFTPVFGADGQGATPVGYALSTPGGASGQVDTASGQAVNLSLSSGQIQGRTATSNLLVFTVSVSSTGVVTLDQIRSVVHSDPNAINETKTLSAANLVVLTATANDKDGDSASTALNIGQLLVFKDDAPTIGPIDNGLVDLAVGSSVTKTLNGAVGADPNAAAYTIDSFTASITVNGLELRGVLAGNKQSVTYYADTSGDTTFGNTGDTALYRLTLSQTGAGTYTFDVLATPPPTVLHFDFNQLHSGSNLFGTIGDTSNALVIIAEHPKLKADGTLDTSGQAVKTSQGGTGATIGVDSQMVDPGEGVFFTYVKGSPSGLVGANLDQGEANDSAAIQYSNGTLSATSASMTISQTQGPTPGTMTISTFDVAGSPQQKAFVDGINTAGAAGIGTAVSITSITIHKANGTTVTETAGGANTSANISFSGGVATVSGLGAGDTIEWTTSAAHDRVLIKGVAGKFDIGGFDITQAQATPDQKLDFVVKVTDGDGDTNTAGFSVGIDGTGNNDDGIVTFAAPANISSSLFGLQTINEVDELLG